MIPVASVLLFFCICISPIRSSVSVYFSSYPTIAAAPLDQNLLNDLATRYQYIKCNTTNPPKSVEDFVFVWLPLWAFDTLSDPGLINRRYTVKEVLGILYFSGYWGGVWLRDKLRFPPTAVNTTGTTAAAQIGVSTAISAAESGNATNYTSGQVATVVFSFGYNAGYLRTIINTPPESVPSPTPNDYNWGFTYYPNKALIAEYDTPQLVSPLAKMKDWIDDLNLSNDFESLKNICIAAQGPAYATGVSVWSTRAGLNVVGFSLDNYILLLKASAAFLELAQYNALLITESVGYQSIPIAKKAANNDAAMKAFNGAYSVGLLDGSKLPFPTFLII